MSYPIYKNIDLISTLDTMEDEDKALFIKSVIQLINVRSEQQTNPINLYIELVSGLYSSMQQMYLPNCTRPSLCELETELERYLVETTPNFVESLDRLYIPNDDLPN